MPFGDTEQNTTLKRKYSQKKALGQGYHCKAWNKSYHELKIHVDHEFLDGGSSYTYSLYFIPSFLRSRCNTLLFSKDIHSYKVPSKYI
jgi:hypothetical protein